MCKSRFQTLLKPRRDNPDHPEVTAIRKGHGSVPTAHDPHDELFSLLFFCPSRLYELPSRCAPRHYWWASTPRCRQDTVGLSTRFWLPLCPSSALHVSWESWTCWRGTFTLRMLMDIFCFFSRPSVLKLRLCGHRMWWRENYPNSITQPLEADMNLYEIKFKGHILAARIKNMKIRVF